MKHEPSKTIQKYPVNCQFDISNDHSGDELPSQGLKACCCRAAVPPVCDALSPLAPNGSCTAGTAGCWDTTEMVISWNIDGILMKYSWNIHGILMEYWQLMEHWLVPSGSHTFWRSAFFGDVLQWATRNTCSCSSPQWPANFWVPVGLGENAWP